MEDTYSNIEVVPITEAVAADNKESVKDELEIEVVEIAPVKTVNIGRDINPKLRMSLVELLRQSEDVFAYSEGDMPGVDP